MSEGSLEAPTRHPIDWTDPDFVNAEKLDAEMRRIFDICHVCRRCFNLCDSFPRLFELIDNSKTGEVDSVKSEDFDHVVDACTLCDMCFMTKCPYVPPHEFNVDFPHLMLRHKAVEFAQGNTPITEQELKKVDRNAKIAGTVAPITNWATKTSNTLTRSLMEKTIGIHHQAVIPKFHGKTFLMQTQDNPPKVNCNAPAYGKKAVIYATCFANYNNPNLGIAARSVLAHNGVETEVIYPSCCGMPQLEHGDLKKVASNAKVVAKELRPWIDQGYVVIALVPSCSLMLKSEWPLIVDDDDNVKVLSTSTYDISQYIVSLSKDPGLVEGLAPLDEGVTLHLACHARAQNMGQKAAELLRLIPNIHVDVIERCSGHGGAWGMMKNNFETALKVGKPVARQALKAHNRLVLSECPLAADHIVQGMQILDPETTASVISQHPIEILAYAYGLMEKNL